MSKTKFFGVTGSPVIKSLSPNIWNCAFEKSGIDAVYLRLCADKVSDSLDLAKEIGLSAVNVTSPFKQDVNPKLGPVNSVIFKQDGSLEYLNTDVDGFLSSYYDTKAERDKPALVLGAGGAARAAVLALKKAGVKNISLANRTKSKAEELCQQYGLGLFEWSEVNDALNDKYNVFSCVSNNDVIKTPFDADYRKTDFGRRWLCYQAQSLFKRYYQNDPFDVMFRALEKAVGEDKYKRSIALIGFMGSGKSLVAKLLASKLGYELVDLDELIEQKEGCRISEIFASRGEPYFRELEKDLLKGLDLKKPMILATGGGTVVDPQNSAFLSQNFTVVWLWANLFSIYSRIENGSRPLFKGDIQGLFDKRRSLYAKASDLCVNNSCYNEQVIVDLLLRNLLYQP